jgi:transposase-like protein
MLSMGMPLQQLTKRVLEPVLEGEITDHLGYDEHDPAGKGSGNSRNGHRSKTVTTDVGPVEIEVPRDRSGSFEPQLVKKRQRRRPPHPRRPRSPTGSSA